MGRVGLFIDAYAWNVLWIKNLQKLVQQKNNNNETISNTIISYRNLKTHRTLIVIIIHKTILMTIVHAGMHIRINTMTLFLDWRSSLL